MFKNFILVFIGGGLGSGLRYILSKYLNASTLIPYGTLIANIGGSLILGIALGWAIKTNNLSTPTNLLISVGFCGGFTTFSTFSFENYALLKSGDYFPFLLYFFGSLLIGLLSIIAGVFISKLF